MAFMWRNLKFQFKQLDITDFPDVVVPLASAERRPSLLHPPSRHASVSAPADAEKTGEGLTDTKKEGKSSEDHGSDSAGSYNVNTIEGLRAEVEADLASFGLDSQYDRKSKLINKAIQDMGMGRYQWQLFVLCGFGWFADNFWLQGVSTVLTPVAAEFGITGTNVRFTTLALFVGLCVGASFWGIASDVIGRRPAFNTTLFLAAVFGTAAGGANNWITLCALLACTGVGVGGNLPVDGALFLEFLPMASGNLLTFLSVWWPIGAFLAALIAWGLIPNYSCDTTLDSCNIPGVDLNNCSPCTKAENWGWRYLLFVLGCITFLQWTARFVFFRMLESPKQLLSRGKQREAVAVVYGIAHANGKKTWLTEEILNEIGGYPDEKSDLKLSNKEIITRSLSKFSTQRIGPLFSHWKIGLTTVLLWFQWATIGMGYPLFNAFLPQYLRTSGGAVNNSTFVTYRDYLITNAVGVPGSILAAYTVDIRYIGRKGTMAIATMITGIFLFLFTASTDAQFQLAFSSLVAFFQNIAYGVLYAYTPEVFPAPNRGSGTGVCSFLNRIGGLCAPLVAIYGAQSNPKAPIYASGGLFLAAFASMLALPIETRGKQSL